MTTDSDQQAAQEGVTKSAQGTSTALDDLSAAARRADDTFTSSGILFSRNLGDVISGISASVGAGVRFFETRFQTLRQLTDYGINFNYNMQSMETSVNNARLTLTEFTGLVREGNDRFVGLGISVSEGTQNFLNSTAMMLNATDEFGNSLESRIARLGYTTDETVEAFLNYQAQLSYSNRSRRRTDQELQRGFLEYTEILDDLAKLTGKERDKLQEAQIEAARDPAVMARELRLPEAVQGMNSQIIGSLSETFGPTIASVAKDILGPGFLQGQNVYAAQFDFVRTLERIRAAQDRGDATEVNRLASLLNAQISEIPTSEVFASLGGIQGNQMSQFADRIVGEMAQERAYLNYQRARQDIERETGRPATPEEINRRVQAELDRQRSLTRPPSPDAPPTGAEAYTAFIEAQISSERRNQQLRQGALDEAYGLLSGVVTGLAGTLTVLNNGLSQDIANIQATVRGLIVGINTTAVDMQTQVQAARRAAESLGDTGVGLSGQLGSLFDQYNASTDATEQQTLLGRISDVLAQISALNARQMSIDATNAQIALEGTGMVVNFPMGAVPPSEPQSIGTLGTMGRIFNNWGTETLTALHGMEAVLTPDQLSDLVFRTVDSTLSAAGNNLGDVRVHSALRQIETAFINGMAHVDGRLNTLRSNVRNLPAMNTNEIGAEQITAIVTSAFSSMPTEMRRAFEAALTNTIKSPIDTLVAVNTQNADTSEKIRKGIGNMTTDYLRGA